MEKGDGESLKQAIWDTRWDGRLQGTMESEGFEDATAERVTVETVRACCAVRKGRHS
ncbi:MAG: hypothetical protein JRN21_02225 [Nitrososphaerota archaeon]|nr:hypothetical protein [Nitrososphaerota archaeon]